MTLSNSAIEIWVTILFLGAGTFALRMLFLGLLGGKTLPVWAMRLLRYTPVAVIPALVAPMVLWPNGMEGGYDFRLIGAALITLLSGYLTKQVLWAVIAGGAFYALWPFVMG